MAWHGIKSTILILAISSIKFWLGVEYITLLFRNGQEELLDGISALNASGMENRWTWRIKSEM